MTTRRQLLRSAAMLGAAGSIAAMPQAFAGGHAQTAQSQKDMSPDEALAEMKAGNQRFVSGNMRNRDLMSQVKATADGQYPFAVVLGCIDSRVPPELVFDQGIGDIFSPRIAGNFANTDIIGSIEFATQLAGSKLVVVLGHTQCGAVKGACDGAELGNLTQTLSNISPALYAVKDVKGSRNSKNGEFVQRVADENVRLTVSALTDRSAVLSGLVAEKKLKIVGAMHNVSTGKVTFSA